MTKIDFKIITPERVVYEANVDSITLPAREGEITVLPHHKPIVSLLSSGVITVRNDSGEAHIASSGGFVEVLPQSKVIVLADTAERAEELAWEIVEEAKKRAEEALVASRNADDVSQAAAFGSLERELARIKALRKRGVRHEKRHEPHTES